MKKNLVYFILLICIQISFGQEVYLKIVSGEKSELKKIDSIGYIKKHKTMKNVLDEITSFESKLQTKGFFSFEKKEVKKINDSIVEATFTLNKQNKKIHVYIGDDFELIGALDKKITLNIIDLENFMKKSILNLESKGFSLAKIQLKNLVETKNELFSELEIITNEKRIVNEIVIKGFDKFPKNHLKAIEKKNRNLIFNQNSIRKIKSDFEKVEFAKQIKQPEILFTKDSTKLFVYLEKTKTNSFDGILGFTNADKKLIFNGYLDLKLRNILNTGEKFNLYWRSDGKNQKTFDASIEMPYVLNSFGIKGQLNIFKQDSIFQNAKTEINLGYYFDYNSKVFIGYQNTESSDIQNTNNGFIKDYKNTFITSNFEKTIPYPENNIFSEKTKILFKVGWGKRESLNSTQKQFFGKIDLMHNIMINKKNSINIRNESFYLDSDKFIINELYRFGGINSIRGFNENNLQANAMSAILTEYRYLANENLYIHSIIDYGYYQDKVNNLSDTLTGLGFGIGLNTKNGFLNLVYANGSSKKIPLKLSNSIFHISVKTRF